MVRVIFAAWIPRTYLHLNEVFRKASSIKADIKNIKSDSVVSFDIADAGLSFKFEMNPSGLYTLTGNVKEELIEDFKVKAENLLLHKIISTCHTVTYKQILNDSLPLSKCSAIISGKGTYYDKNNPYQEDSIVYVKDEYADSKAIKIHLEAMLFAQFLYRMMERMENLYHKANDVAELLEKEGKLNDIKRAVLGMDLVKKNVAESNSKIDQMIEIFETEKSRTKSLKGTDKTIIKMLETEALYKRIESDKEYMRTLWDLLIAFLDNLDAAAEARLSYQETLESKLIETILGGEVAIALGIAISGIFFIDNGVSFSGVQGIFALTMIFIVWRVLKVVLGRVHTRIGRVRKIGNE